jgi:hypothetical protein
MRDVCEIYRGREGLERERERERSHGIERVSEKCEKETF